MSGSRFLIAVVLIVLILLVQQPVHRCMCKTCLYGHWNGVEWEMKAASYGDTIAATPDTIFIELGLPGNPPCWEVPY